VRRLERRPLALLFGAGAVAGLGLGLAAIGHVAETRTSPLEPDGEVWRVLLVGGLFASFACYLAGLAALRRRIGPVAAVAAVAVVVQLAPLAAPLLLSRDVYLYWDYGRIVTVHDGNPYSDFPEQWPDDPAFRAMSSAWARLRSPYGPAWMLADAAGAKAAGTSASTAAWFFRVAAAVAALVIIGTVAWSTRSAFAVALVGWNPLLALHFAGGGHADAWMMALVAVALALGARRAAAGGAAWAVALAVKVAALAFLGLELVHRLRRRSARWFAGLAGAGVVAIAVATVLFGPDWLRAAGPISNQLRESNSIGLPTRISELGISLHAAQVLVALLFAVLYAWLLLEAWRGRRRLSLAAGALALTVAWLQPWYASWPVVLAAFDRDHVGTALGLGLSGYVLLDALPI
jgi:hypothetical protein